MITIERRTFLRSLALLAASPAIVRASSLMAISPVPTPSRLIACWETGGWEITKTAGGLSVSFHIQDSRFLTATEPAGDFDIARNLGNGLWQKMYRAEECFYEDFTARADELLAT